MSVSLNGNEAVSQKPHYHLYVAPNRFGEILSLFACLAAWIAMLGLLCLQSYGSQGCHQSFWTIRQKVINILVFIKHLRDFHVV